MKTKNKVARALTAARKEKTTVLCSVRNKETGRFDSVKGIVNNIRPTKDGTVLYTIKLEKRKKSKNKKEHEYQSVPLENVLTVRVGEEVVKR